MSEAKRSVQSTVTARAEKLKRSPDERQALLPSGRVSAFYNPVRMLACLASMMLIIALPAGGEEHYTDGYRLLHACGTEQRMQSTIPEEQIPASVDSGYCIGYITGVVDGIHTEERLSSSSRIICEPNIRAGQIKMIVRRFLEAHPEYLHRSAADLVAVALREAFPCGKSR